MIPSLKSGFSMNLKIIEMCPAKCFSNTKKQREVIFLYHGTNFGNTYSRVQFQCVLFAKLYQARLLCNSMIGYFFESI